MYYLGCFRVFISCVVLFIVQSSDGAEIIGGNEVKPHSLPFMALLEGNKGNCGGILIDQAWVLTAAHCDKIKKVLLGVHSISRDKKNFRQNQKVKKSFPHPCFDAKDKVNDLMLLKLNKKVKKTETVNWLKLVNTVKDPAAGSICLVAGWGKTEKNNSSDVLLSVNVTVIDRKKCNSADYYNHKPVITCNMICAGSIGRKTADTCQGDSGGPLLCNGVLTGITSFGPKECGNKTHPGVYAFLSDEQLQWIKKTMTQN